VAHHPWLDIEDGSSESARYHTIHHVVPWLLFASVHEASHAVVAHALGLHVTGIRVGPRQKDDGELSNGRVEIREVEEFNKVEEFTRESVELGYALGVVFMAGGVGTRIAGLRDAAWMNAGDHREIGALASTLGYHEKPGSDGRAAVSASWVADLAQAATKILANDFYWDAVGQLAGVIRQAALNGLYQLTEADCDKIFETIGVDRGGCVMTFGTS
jgi:hypothetical protein